MHSNHLRASSFNTGQPPRPRQHPIPHSLPISVQEGRQPSSYPHGWTALDPPIQLSSPRSSQDHGYVVVSHHPTAYTPSNDMPSSSSASTSSVSSLFPSSSSSHPNDLGSWMENRSIQDSVDTIRAESPSPNRSETDLPYEVSLLGFPRENRVDIYIKPTIELCGKRHSAVGTVPEYTALRMPQGFKARSAISEPLNRQTLGLSAQVYCAGDLTKSVTPCNKCCQRVRRKRADKTSASPVPMIEFTGSTIAIANGRAKLRFIINCYCRHHAESTGFRIFFTLYQHERKTVGQVMTDPIRITDNRKPKGEPGSEDNYGEPATPSTTADSDVPMESFDETDPFTIGEQLPEASLSSRNSNIPPLHPMNGVSSSIEYNPRPIRQQRGRNLDEPWLPSLPVPSTSTRINDTAFQPPHEQLDSFHHLGASHLIGYPQITGINPGTGPAQGGDVQFHGVNFNYLRMGGFWIAFGNVYFPVNDTTTSPNGVLQIRSNNVLQCVVPPGTPHTTVRVRLLAGQTLNEVMQTQDSFVSSTPYCTYTYTPAFV